MPETPEDIAASLKRQAKTIYNNMTGVFNRGAKTFWNNPNASPQQIADALGNDGRELFELHARLGALISSIDPIAILEGMSHVKNFTYDENGKVIITE